MLEADLIASLFTSEVPDAADWEARYPQRDLPSGAAATRFAPSPTGFLHTGGIYVATISRNIARHSGGTYFVRIEDTDQAREIPEARAQFTRAFKYFSLQSDEDDNNSPWGPYEQSRRASIYHTYARDLLMRDRAYLCFCSREDLTEMSDRQQAAKVTSGYYGPWARCRNLSSEEVRQRLKENRPYTIRFRSPAAEDSRVVCADLIRGSIEHTDNRNDVILLKSSDHAPRLPTYHFAHVIDDHLMRVTLVVRGEEWLSSVPLHLQLFTALDFKPVMYAHIAPLMKTDGASRRKLSKRKDPEANVEFYMASGYPAGAVLHYLRGLANSRLAEMTFDQASAAPIRLAECGVAGPMFDLVKLESISRQYISSLPVDTALDYLLDWADRYDTPFAQILRHDLPLTRRALGIEREPSVTQRKDLAKWASVRSIYGIYFPSLFNLVTNPADPRFTPLPAMMVRMIAGEFAHVYKHFASKDEWFEQVRSLAGAHGFAPSIADYRNASHLYQGSIRDVSNVIRVALTGAVQSPDLHRVAQIIGPNEVLRRINALA